MGMGGAFFFTKRVLFSTRIPKVLWARSGSERERAAHVRGRILLSDFLMQSLSPSLGLSREPARQGPRGEVAACLRQRPKRTWYVNDMLKKGRENSHSV